MTTENSVTRDPSFEKLFGPPRVFTHNQMVVSEYIYKSPIQSVWSSQQRFTLLWVRGGISDPIVGKYLNPMFHAPCNHGEDAARSIVSEAFDKYWADPYILPGAK